MAQPLEGKPWRQREAYLRCILLAVAVAAAPIVATADVWDRATTNDDASSSTHNELVHGTSQIHDLPVNVVSLFSDQDWYLIGQEPLSSYEVVVDATTGDIGYTSTLLQRVGASGGTVQLAFAITDAIGHGYSLRWANTSTSGVADERVLVSTSACGSTCSGDDQYHIRMRDTTIGVPRFNVTGTQSTIVLTQNASDRPISAHFAFWGATGALVHQLSVSIGARALHVLNLATIPSLVGKSGHLTIANDGRYGSLNVKAVALEPATGFTFDTLGAYKPY
jgi:hypothetical protein